MTIRIGSRGSDLALWQAHHVQTLLKKHAGVESDITIIHTKGDNLQHVAFNQIEGKGFFTKEIEEALLANRIDLAVHSLKDLPTDITPGLDVAAVSEREDPRDILLIHPEAYDQSKNPPVIANARIGTSSNRRKKQLTNLRPDVQAVDIRGNVPTRLKKLQERQFDGLIMALAGLNRLRLDLSSFKTVILEPKTFIPNPGQGILGLQIRRDDAAVRSHISKLNSPLSAQIVTAERGLLARMQGGCQLALGAYCYLADGRFNYHAFWDELNGNPSHHFEAQSDDPNWLAESAYYSFMRSSRRLAGKTVVLTRPEHQIGEWRNELERFGARVISRPAIRIVPDVPAEEMDGVANSMNQWSWIIFTSANSVAVFWDELLRRHVSLSPSTRIAAIGRSTEAELLAKAVPVDFVPSRSNGSDFAMELVAERNIHGRVLMPCAHKADTVIQDYLAEHGLKVTRLNLYRTEKPNATDIPAMEPSVDFVVFASPSAYENFVKLSPIPSNVRIISIGPKTSEHIRKSGRSDFVEAQEPTIEEIILKMLNTTL